MDKKVFSIVVPVFQNERNLESTIPTLLELQKKLPGYELELVFVDDGSKDGSHDILMKYHQLNPEMIRVVKLVKNFGQIIAIQAGLANARGDCVGIISADLQDPPEIFQEMIAAWENGHKLVIAERKDRQENFFRVFVSNLYWKIVRIMAVKDYPTGGFDFCLVDRDVVEIVNQVKEKNSHIFVLIFSLGYSYHSIGYVRQKRIGGKSQWTLSKKIQLSIDTLVNFSYVPLRFISYLGLAISFLSCCYGLTVLIFWIFKGNPVEGWTTITILLSGLSGLILLTLGIIGEYLWRLFDTVKDRPIYIIEKTTDIQSKK
ncbi:MAG: glycosyltransferase [Opitutae bacterium]|nr:glycosyltransferase [Opitutae bacterium]|tara:strand:- start:997 stop:1944 length:948 start_codon:yes stop_codon:yes gene_type:complete